MAEVPQRFLHRVGDLIKLAFRELPAKDVEYGRGGAFRVVERCFCERPGNPLEEVLLGAVFHGSFRRDVAIVIDAAYEKRELCRQIGCLINAEIVTDRVKHLSQEHVGASLIIPAEVLAKKIYPFGDNLRCVVECAECVRRHDPISLSKAHKPNSKPHRSGCL